MMTIAEQLRQEGEKLGEQRGIEKGILKGRQEGIQLGEQKGEKNASVKIARQLLANGVDRAIVKMSTGLSDAEINALMD
uniref:Putative transposase n=1 Tax=Arsenophonus nasoniae TaxID=638 RepID=D2U2V3_9GAMM|nr:putative transposase [Arsenophonus nasoniae]